MKKSTILLVLALVAVIALAAVGYNSLKDQIHRESLSILGGEGTEPVHDQGETATDPGSPTQTPTQTPAESTSPTEAAREYTVAPDFQVLDGQGNLVSLSDFRGKPVVLNFWASWCGPCKREMPEFDKVCAELGDQIHFMMVNLTDGSSETVEGVTAFIGEQGYSFPVYFDTLSEGAMAYGVSSIPATYFIDAEGRLIAYGVGTLDEQALRQGIDMLQTGAGD